MHDLDLRGKTISINNALAFSHAGRVTFFIFALQFMLLLMMLLHFSV